MDKSLEDICIFQYYGIKGYSYCGSENATLRTDKKEDRE